MRKSMARTATRALLSAVTLSAALTAAAGCKGSKPEAPAPAPASAPTAAAPAPPAAATATPGAPAAAPAAAALPPVVAPANKDALATKPGPGAVAVVNGTEIADATFADDLAAASLYAKAATEKGRREVLDRRIDFLLEIQDARRAGFLDRPMVKRMIARTLRRYVVQEVKREIAIEAAKIPTEQIDARIAALPKTLFDLTVILCEDLETADKAIARVKAGEDMEAVAREVSDSPGIGTGNARRIGFIPGGGMYPPDVDAAIQALALGQLSAPIPTPVGYLVARLDTVRDVPENETRKARERMMAESFNERSAKRVAEILEKATKEAKRTVLLEKIADVKLPSLTVHPALLWRQFEDVRLMEVNGTLLTLGDLFYDKSDYERFLGTTNLQASYEDLRGRAAEEVLVAAYGAAKGYDRLPRFEAALKDYVDSLLAAQYLADIVIAAGPLEQVDDAVAKAWFLERKERFPSPDVLTLSQIVVRREAEALAVRDRLRAGGNFAELAKQSSVDPSAKQGGDLGSLSGPALDKLGGKEMTAELVARAKKKDWGPFTLRTTAGYHIIVIRGYVPAGSENYEAVRDPVRKAYWATQLQQAVDTRVAALRAVAVIGIDDKKVAAIQPSASPEGGSSSPHGSSMTSPRGPSPHAGQIGKPGANPSPHGGGHGAR
jgi:parvulin-like peptidyl-prolyl isomerase